MGPKWWTDRQKTNKQKKNITYAIHRHNHTKYLTLNVDPVVKWFDFIPEPEHPHEILIF